MRRLSILAAIAIAACGLDVVATAASSVVTPDGGSVADADPPIQTGDDDDVAPPDAGADAELEADVVTLPPFEAGLDDGGITLSSDGGSPELLFANLPDLRTIAVHANILYVGTSGASQTLDLATGVRTSIGEMTNVNAFAFHDPDVLFASRSNLFGRRGPGGTVTRASNNPTYDIVSTPDRVTAAADNHVVSVNYDFTNPISFPTSASNTIHALATDQDSLFWADNRGSIVRSSTDGQGITTLQNPSAPTSLLVDGASLVFLTSSTIERVDKGSGQNPVELANSAGLPLSIAQDGDFYYWVGSSLGRLNRIARIDGTSAAVLQGKSFTDLTYTHLVAFDAAYVYWASPGDGKVVRLKK